MSQFTPTNLAQVFAHLAKAVEAFELEKLENWEDLESAAFRY